MKRRIKFFRIIFIILFFIGLCSVFFLMLAGLQIKKIEITGEAAIVDVNVQLLSTSLLFFPSQRMAQKIQEDNPLIRSVQLKKKFPSTLVIQVVKRKPIAVLNTEGYEYAIDDEGMILTKDAAVDDANIPVIQISAGVVRIGSLITDGCVIQAIRFLNLLPVSITISHITAEDRLSLLARYKTTDILIPQQGDLMYTIDTLQTLIAGFTIKGIMPKTIDLRYTKPVVQF